MQIMLINRVRVLGSRSRILAQLFLGVPPGLGQGTEFFNHSKAFAKNVVMDPREVFIRFVVKFFNLTVKIRFLYTNFKIHKTDFKKTLQM